LIYFKQSAPLALEWFKMADPVFQNWRGAYQKLFNERKPLTFDKNVIANIVTHLLDIEAETTVVLNNFYDIDTISQRLWHYDIPENWTEMLNFWYTDDQTLIIENSVIGSGIIHYRDNNFLTKEVLDVLRANTNISSKRKETA
jgi:hypothetical protein